MYMQSQHCKLESQACRDCPFRCPFRCSSSSRGSHDGPSAAPTIASVCWFDLYCSNDLSLNPILTILYIYIYYIILYFILYYIIYILYIQILYIYIYCIIYIPTPECIEIIMYVPHLQALPKSHLSKHLSARSWFHRSVRKHNEDLSLEIQGCSQQVLDGPGGNELTCGYTSFNDHIYVYIVIHTLFFKL